MTRADACKKARESSKDGYVQHVNRYQLPIHGDEYVVSDWYDDDTTCDSFENGRRIGGIDRFVDEA